MLIVNLTFHTGTQQYMHFSSIPSTLGLRCSHPIESNRHQFCFRLKVLIRSLSSTAFHRRTIHLLLREITLTRGNVQFLRQLLRLFAYYFHGVNVFDFLIHQQVNSRYMLNGSLVGLNFNSLTFCYPFIH